MRRNHPDPRPASKFFGVEGSELSALALVQADNSFLQQAIAAPFERSERLEQAESRELRAGSCVDLVEGR